MKEKEKSLLEIAIELLNGKKELLPYVDEYILEITDDKIIVKLLEEYHD